MDPLVLGLGATGLSVMRHLSQRGLRPWGVEASAEALDQAKKGLQSQGGAWRLHAESEFRCGYLRSVERLYCSPGISDRHPIVARCRQLGLPVHSDIDLFVQQRTGGKVAAITGVNGKSTVTAWLAHILNAAGHSAVACGNFGKPVLEALAEDHDFYALELSSFQLQNTARVGADVAAFLNFSEDHRDRHPDPAQHLAAKNRVFLGAARGVYPKSLARWVCEDDGREDLIYGHKDGATGVDCGPCDGRIILHGEDVGEMPNRSDLGAGWRNNLMATFSLAVSLGVEPQKALRGLRCFPGLPHRCRVVAKDGGVVWVDDAKGTNPGATEAAVKTFRAKGEILLLLGGDAKGVNLRSLAGLPGVRAVLFFGSNAEQIERAVRGSYPETLRCADLAQAVERAGAMARQGDVVLFSPACASDPEEGDYHRRGDLFTELARGYASRASQEAPA